MNPTFRSQSTIAAGSYPQALVSADVNRDGISDLVVADNGTDVLSVLLGNGQGGFTPSNSISTGGNEFTALATLDVNNDGLPDVVGVKDFYGNDVAVFLNDGKGGFTAGPSVLAGTRPTGIDVADLNGDGRQDLVVANSGSNTVSVILSRGSGFSTAVSYPASNTIISRLPLTAYDVAVADFNGDGKPDIAVSDYSDNAVDVLLGNGNGGFGPPTAYTGVYGAIPVAAADLNGDGRPDLIVGCGLGSYTYVLLANGTGGFGAPTSYNTVADVASIAVADFNGDGLLDIVVGGNVSAAVTVLVNLGNGQFSPQTLTTGAAPESVLAMDVNGDGKPDILTANLSNDTISVLLNTTPGLFPPSSGYGMHGLYSIAITAPGSVSVTTIATGSTQAFAIAQSIQFADGTARLDPTGNAEEVARLYKAAFGRAPDLSGLGYWTDLIDANKLGLGNVASAFMGSGELVAQYGSLSHQALVSQLFQNVLGRDGDSGGVAYWTAQLDAGAAASTVLLGFSDSIENKDLTRGSIGDKDASEAYRLYRAALNRMPDAGGLDYWTTILDQGMSPSAVASSFMTTQEFATAYSGKDDTGFVNQLYQNVLHRSADASGSSFWMGSLAGGASKASVLVGFSDSAENRNATGAATHDGWVFVAR